MDSWPLIKLIVTRLKQLKLLTFRQEQDLGCLIFASFKSNLMQNKKNTIRNEQLWWSLLKIQFPSNKSQTGLKKRKRPRLEKTETKNTEDIS